MEMLVVVGFFIICASICVLVFVKADNISKDARDINQAVLKAQSLAEELKAGQALRWSEMLPDRNIWEHLSCATAEGPIRERCCTGCRQRPMPAPKAVYRRIWGK